MDDRDSWEDKIPLIEAKIGHTFRNRSLIKSAFTHRSLLNEQLIDHECNQRLEFLGDALLGAIIAHFLFVHFPTSDEGVLTKRRAQIIDQSSCAEYAKRMNLAQYLLIGKGLSANLGLSPLADLFEAITGAIFLDSGYFKTEQFVLVHCRYKLDLPQLVDEANNFKSILQSKAHKLVGDVPLYAELSQEGPLHRRQFTIGVSLKGKFLGSGSGSSKKSAEQRAARAALAHLDRDVEILKQKP